MNFKTKLVVTIVGTLVMGVLLGALLSGAATQYRTQQTESLRTADGFAKEIIKAAKPQDEQQFDLLRSTLIRHGEVLDSSRAACRSKIHTTVDSLRTELNSLLTEEQRQRVDQRIGEIRQEQRGQKSRSDAENK